MAFERKNRVQDPVLAKAFKEGFAEGQAMAGERTMWHVTVSFEGTALNEELTDDIIKMLSVVQHYAQTPGTTIEIEVTTDGADAPTPVQARIETVADDVEEIEDAEVVEE